MSVPPATDSAPKFVPTPSDLSAAPVTLGSSWLEMANRVLVGLHGNKCSYDTVTWLHCKGIFSPLVCLNTHIVKKCIALKQVKNLTTVFHGHAMVEYCMRYGIMYV